MLPKNKLAYKMLDKLKVYAGDKHPHQAQNPAAERTGDQEPTSRRRQAQAETRRPTTRASQANFTRKLNRSKS